MEQFISEAMKTTIFLLNTHTNSSHPQLVCPVVCRGHSQALMAYRLCTWRQESKLQGFHTSARNWEAQSINQAIKTQVWEETIIKNPQMWIHFIYYLRLHLEVALISILQRDKSSTWLTAVLVSEELPFEWPSVAPQSSAVSLSHKGHWQPQGCRPLALCACDTYLNLIS